LKETVREAGELEESQWERRKWYLGWAGKWSSACRVKLKWK
jgi:hypothetical protein